MTSPVADERSSYELTVIVPVHRADYLEELLRSLLAQTVAAEIIVVVDGVLSDVLSVVDRWTEVPGLTVITLPASGGAGHARNVGLEHAQGTFIAFADADDVVPPDAYERLLHSVRATGDDVATGAAVQFLRDGTEIRYWTTDGTLHDAERRSLRLDKEPTLAGDHTPWNKVFRRSFLEDNGLRFPEGTTSEDVGFWATVAVLARVCVVPEVVYRHRRHDGSVTAGLVDAVAIGDWGLQLRLASGAYASIASPAAQEFFYRRLLRREMWTRVRRLPELDDEARDALVEVVRWCLEDAPASVIGDLTPLRAWSYRLLATGAVEAAVQLMTMIREPCERDAWDAWNTEPSVQRVLPEPSSSRTLSFWREVLLFPYLRSLEAGCQDGDPAAVLKFLAADEDGTENPHEEQVLAALRARELSRVAVMRKLRSVRATVFVTSLLGLAVIRRVELSGKDAIGISGTPVIAGARSGQSRVVRVIRTRRVNLLRVSLRQQDREIMETSPRVVEGRGTPR